MSDHLLFVKHAGIAFYFALHGGAPISEEKVPGYHCRQQEFSRNSSDSMRGCGFDIIITRDYSLPYNTHAQQ
jgi:hypothetical protein